MRLEEAERQVLAEVQGLVARGVTKGLPTFRAEVERIDAALAAEPEPMKQVDADVLEFRRALGVA